MEVEKQELTHQTIKEEVVVVGHRGVVEEGSHAGLPSILDE